MSDEPQKVDVKIESPRPMWNPFADGTAFVKTITGLSAAGVVFALFAFLVIRLLGSDDRVIEKVQVMLDKQEDRRSKEHDKEIARIEKQHDIDMTQMRDWNKAISERQTLENDKLRLELKAMTEQLKLMTDRFRMAQNMKD